MKILAIDDEPLALNGLASEVKKAAPESELRVFTDPSAAIQELAQSAWTPDVALLDIEMPAVSGLALAEHIKEACPRCNIIFVTGYSQYALGALGIFGSVLPLAMTTALTGLELLVAFLQAYVFAILTCIYLNDALHPGH